MGVTMKRLKNGLKQCEHFGPQSLLFRLKAPQNTILMWLAWLRTYFYEPFQHLWSRIAHITLCEFLRLEFSYDFSNPFLANPSKAIASLGHQGVMYYEGFNSNLNPYVNSSMKIGLRLWKLWALVKWCRRFKSPTERSYIVDRCMVWTLRVSTSFYGINLRNSQWSFEEVI